MAKADEMMLDFARRKANLKLSQRPWRDRTVDLLDRNKLFVHPFLFITGDGACTFTEEERANLLEYFRRGGFLYADDCVLGPTGNLFYQGFIREIDKLMPNNPMRPVPYSHPIYHCFYEFPEGAPFCKGQPMADMGLFLDDRLVAFLTPGDIHCGWYNRFTPPGLQTPSLKMGVNIIVYSLTH